MSKIVPLSILAIALLGLLGVWAGSALSTNKEAGLGDVALSLQDVPSSWVPADFNEVHMRGLWDTLSDVLTANTQAVLHLSAFEAESGLSGASTVLIQVEQSATLPQNIADEHVLGALARLVARHNALLVSQQPDGNPQLYFESNEPRMQGSLRARQVRLVGDDQLYFDSIIFSTGPVLAIVTTWQPAKRTLSIEITRLAAAVDQRLRTYLEGLGVALSSSSVSIQGFEWTAASGEGGRGSEGESDRMCADHCVCYRMFGSADPASRSRRLRSFAGAFYQGPVQFRAISTGR